MIEKKISGGQTKFLPDVHMTLITELAEQGMTDQQIADRIGITNRTLQNWKNAQGDLFQSLKTSKILPDDRVELSLFDRALGYPYEEVTLEPNAAGELVVTKLIRKQSLPDVTAQIFWLKNRRPDRWREKAETDVVIKDYRVIPADLTKLIKE